MDHRVVDMDPQQLTVRKEEAPLPNELKMLFYFCLNL